MIMIDTTKKEYNQDRERERKAIEFWNSLIREEFTGDRMMERLRDEERKLGHRIGRDSLCSVLRPHFISEKRLKLLSRVSEVVLSAHRKVLAAIMSNEKLRRESFSNFNRWMSGIYKFEVKRPIHATSLRFDAAFEGNRLRFIELNADMPGAVGMNDTVGRFLLSLPAAKRFAEKFPCRPLLLQPAFLNALLEEWKVSGGSSRPTIALVTWRDDTVSWGDMIINRDFFQARGFKTMVVDPRDLEFDGRLLRGKGEKIDLVYRVVSTAQSLNRRDEVKALVRADNAGAVIMANSYRCELLGHKAVFAMLSDPEFTHVFNSKEKEAVRKHIPWTRLAREETTTDPEGKQIDLIPWILDYREKLVLKPTHDFGGHGVTLGWDITPGEWEEALKSALQSDYIVQERISLTREPYPLARPNLPERIFNEDIDPFLLGGRFAGLLTRLGETDITNIHAHGTLTANFLLLDQR